MLNVFNLHLIHSTEAGPFLARCNIRRSLLIQLNAVGDIYTPCQHGQVRVLRRTVVPRFKPSSRWKTEVTVAIRTIYRQLQL